MLLHDLQPFLSFYLQLIVGVEIVLILVQENGYAAITVRSGFTVCVPTFYQEMLERFCVQILRLKISSVMSDI